MFYLLSGTTITPIKKTEALLEVLGDKRSEVQAFITSNKIKANKEDGLKAVVAYYNKL